LQVGAQAVLSGVAVAVVVEADVALQHRLAGDFYDQVARAGFLARLDHRRRLDAGQIVKQEGDAFERGRFDHLAHLQPAEKGLGLRRELFVAGGSDFAIAAFDDLDRQHAFGKFLHRHEGAGEGVAVLAIVPADPVGERA
jgi:hypothetical protein